MVANFKELKVWRKAIEIGKRVYEISRSFPDNERYGLTSQIRRAIVSVSSNIAEGCGRKTNRDFGNFLYIAMGSIREVQSQLFIAKELGYLDDVILDELDSELEELAKMLTGFIKYVSGLNIK
ncbi:four helix bundle protein [Candidatus Pacearchaeota archaeon]|nr:four helix bundle protein [Candidatus Pacearchaeota archaeon]